MKIKRGKHDTVMDIVVSENKNVIQKKEEKSSLRTED